MQATDGMLCCSSMGHPVPCLVALAIVLAACSEETVIPPSPTTGGSGGASVASSVSTSGAGGATLVAACPPGEFAVAYQNDELSCAAVDAVVRDAVNADCSLYFGWRDG